MYQKQFAEYFDKHMDEILRDLDEIISIESVGDINALLSHLVRVLARLLTGERLILKSLA